MNGQLEGAAVRLVANFIFGAVGGLRPPVVIGCLERFYFDRKDFCLGLLAAAEDLGREKQASRERKAATDQRAEVSNEFRHNLPWKIITGGTGG